jgi:hypothetical protein
MLMVMLDATRLNVPELQHWHFTPRHALSQFPVTIESNRPPQLSHVISTDVPRVRSPVGKGCRLLARDPKDVCQYDEFDVAGGGSACFDVADATQLSAQSLRYSQMFQCLHRTGLVVHELNAHFICVSICICYASPRAWCCDI